MSASDREVKSVYEAFRQFVSVTLRDDDNPNLKTCSFNEVPEQTLTDIEIPLNGLRRGSIMDLASEMDNFIHPGADIIFEENSTGKFDFFAVIPLPRSNKSTSPRRRGKHHHHHHHDEETAPSCMPLLTMLGILMVLVAIGFLRTLE